MSERTVDDLSEATDLLGQMCDLAVKIRLSDGPRRDSEAYCIFCGDVGRTPPNVMHKNRCVVAKAQDFLQKR